MKNTENIPFHQQLTKSFAVLFLLFFSSSALLLFFYLQQNSKLAFFVDSQVPLLKQQQEFHALLLRNDTLITEMLDKRSTLNLAENYQQTTKNLQRLAQLYSGQSNVIGELLRKNNALDKNIMRINQQERRNGQLKQDVLIQLQLILDSLSKIIEQNEAKQRTYHQLLLTNNVRRSVSRNEARIQAQLTNSLSRHRRLYDQISTIFSDFEALSLFYTTINFDLVSQNVEKFLTQWSQHADIEQENIEPSLKVKIEQLRQLFFGEQRTLAKWRGYLRLSEEFFNALNLQKAQLRTLENDTSINNLELPTLIPSSISTAFNGEKVNFTTIHFHLLFSFFIFVITLLFLWLVTRIR